jgi:hypothetical protein
LDIFAGGATLRYLRDSLGELSLMHMNVAIVALGALAGEPRLALFRLLVQAGDMASVVMTGRGGKRTLPREETALA